MISDFVINFRLFFLTSDILSGLRGHVLLLILPGDVFLLLLLKIYIYHFFMNVYNELCRYNLFKMFFSIITTSWLIIDIFINL